MGQNSSKIEIQADFSLFIISALSILLLPLKWVIAWLIASGIHELGHYIALKIFRIHIHTVTFSHNGVIMHTEPIAIFPSLICYLSGPLCGMLLLLGVYRFPHLAICGFFQSLFNLMPIYPLDGGRALDAILFACFTDRVAIRMKRTIMWVTLCILFLISLHLSLRFDRGYVCFLVYSLLLLKVNPIKIPCKHRDQIVQ